VEEYNAKKNIQTPIPRQRIALDYGQVFRVVRSHGRDLSGNVLNRCSRLVNIAQKGGHILTTSAFYEVVKQVFPKEFFDKIVVYLGSPEVKGFGELECWELLWTDNHGYQIKPMKLGS